MKTKDAWFNYDGEAVRIKLECYQQGGLAACVETIQGEAVATLSVKLGESPAEDCFWLKDWSENENIAKAIISSGLVEPTGRKQETGFVTAKEVRIKW